MSPLVMFGALLVPLALLSAVEPSLPGPQDVVRHPFAVWPLPDSNLTSDVRKTVLQEYPDRTDFLRAVERQLHQSLAALQPGVRPLPSELRTFLDTPEQMPFKDLMAALIPLLPAPNATEAGEPLKAFLRKLAELPPLRQTRFLVVPSRLTLGRGIANHSGADVFFGGGATPTMVTSGAETTASLRVMVLDLVAPRVVWEKRIVAGASSSFFKASAIHEVEKSLGTTLVEALASR